MECYQLGCGERPVWQVTLTYRSVEPGATPVVLSEETGACWKHRAQLLRLYGGARGAARIQTALRNRGVDPGMADLTKALLTPIFG
ncbi:MAG: hypothetical protein A2V77_22090 [Anaeromyxobacter sp. RBG_16_69_14]|nr:MAG: hypothetical protein A2V77_22090 [Anaeromyxobacter sp. RBG_16_69_14]